MEETCWFLGEGPGGLTSSAGPAVLVGVLVRGEPVFKQISVAKHR